MTTPRGHCPARVMAGYESHRHVTFQRWRLAGRGRGKAVRGAWPAAGWPWCCDRSESPCGLLLTLRNQLVAARYTVGEALIAQPAWEAVATGISANRDECQSIRMSANREERPRCPPVYLSAGGRERYGPPPPATGHL